MSEPRDARRAGLAGLVLFLGTVALYQGALGHGFLAYDDAVYVERNPVVARGLTAEGLGWAFTSVTYACNWHPLTWLSHMLDVQLFGLARPGGHHATSVLLHALNAVLLLGAMRALTRRFWPAVLVAALFAVHPLRVESVAWVAERKDVLAGTFWILTLWLYARWTHAPSPRRYALVALGLALALLAKPIAVTLPAVLLLLDLWPLRRWRGLEPGGVGLADLIREKLPLLALCALSCAMTIWAQTSGGCTGFIAEGVSAGARLQNALIAYGVYLWKALWPTDLSVFYPHPAVVDPEASRAAATALAGLALAGVSAAGLLLVRRAPGVLVGWLWFLGTLVPMLGVVQVGGQALADRYAYLPLIGLQIALVYGLAELVSRRPALRPAAGLAAAAAILVCGVLTVRQVRVWRDTTTLFEHALAVTERNYIAHINLGRQLGDAGRLDAAHAHFAEAVRIVPEYHLARLNLGWVLLLEGDTEAALPELEHAVRLDPGDKEGRYRLGVGLATAGRLDEAERELELARELGHRGADDALAEVARRRAERGE